MWASKLKIFCFVVLLPGILFAGVNCERLEQLVNQFYAAYDSGDIVSASEISATIAKELSPWDALKPIEVNSPVWVPRNGGGRSIGIVKSLENGKAEVLVRGDGAVPENVFSIQDYGSHKKIPIDELTRVNGEEVISILQGRGTRTTVIALKDVPFEVKVIRSESSAHLPPKTPPIKRFEHLLKEEATLTINGNQIPIPHMGRVEIGSNVVIYREDVNGAWRVKQNGKFMALALGGHDYEFSILVDGIPTKILFQSPLYTEITGAGFPRINLKTFQTEEFFEWRKTGLTVSKQVESKLWKLGEEEKIFVYGVSEGVGEEGLGNLIGIAASEKIRPRNPEAPHFGFLTPLSPAGRHGTYFVIIGKSYEEPMKFVLVNQTAVDWFKKGLLEAKQKGLITAKEEISILKRTFTFESFVRSENDKKLTMIQKILRFFGEHR